MARVEQPAWRRRLLAMAPSPGAGIGVFDRNLPREARRRFDAAADAFVAGYRLGVFAGDPAALLAELDRIDAACRGFAHEGAGMAAACRDRLVPDSGVLGALLALCDEPRAALVAVGAGWAQSRLDRPPTECPAGLPVSGRPMCQDGYGFHRGLFHAYRFRARRPFDAVSPAFDRGLGRSLWFVCGAEPARIDALVQAFEADRRPALWRGVGVACAFTGGVGSEVLVCLGDIAGDHRASLVAGVRRAEALGAAVGGGSETVRLAAETLL